MKIIFVLFFSLFCLCHPPLVQAQDNKSAVDFAKGLSETFERVAVSITPSMVSISSVKKVKVKNGNGRRFPDPSIEPWRDFLGEDFFERFAPPEGEGFSQQGMGTGVIIDDKGHILTNNHVVGDADDVTVRLFDKRSFKAEVVGKDPRTDLAVIKIKADKITPAKLGNSDSLKIGQWVIAAGNPFGLDNSITAGIVSAKGRSIMGGSQYEDFIQTDAAINPGNSGGPLVNLDGEVVGINTAIFSRSGGYMGIGFAIPINMAKNITKSLISEGKVIRGWLGVGIQNLTEDLAKSFNYAGSDGALVGHIEKPGPAEKAGIQQGDIIIGIDDHKIKDINQLRNIVASLSPGTDAKVTVIRDGRKQELDIEIGELPSNLPGEPAAIEQPDSDNDLGITVESLTPELRQRLRTTRSSGVVVVRVRPDGPAAESGVQPGDLIVRIDNQEITGLSDFKKAVDDADLGQGIRLVIENQGMQRYVFIKSDN